MIKELLRAIGIGCLIAGTLLYFLPSASSSETKDDDHTSSESETTALRQELARVKKELAIAQKTSSTDNKPTLPKDSSLTESPSAKVLFTIESGTDSSTVAHKLERVGVIQDATAFNRYLQANKLAGKIQIGEYELEVGMDIPTIAARITKTD